MIVVKDRRLATGEKTDGRGGATLELVIVIGIQDVMFAVVLVVHYQFGACETALESRVLRRSLGTRAVGIAAPSDISACQIAVILPTAFVDQRLQAGPVCAGLGTEHPRAGPQSGLVRIYSRVDKRLGLRTHRWTRAKG